MILADGRSSVEIMEKGAYVKSLVLDGLEILKPSEDGVQTHGGMAIMLPYAGRVRNAMYVWEGKQYLLPKNSGEHSIHGLTRELDWAAEKAGENKGIFTIKLSTSNYPTELFLKLDFEINSSSFSIHIEAENKGSVNGPFMAGMHPYFRFKDSWAIESKQNLLRLNFESGFFPDGTITAIKPKALSSKGGMPFDNTYVTNSTPVLFAGDRRIVLENNNMPYLVLYNGQFACKESIAAEPMSAAPDAFNNGIGLVSIPPGEKFRCSATFRLSRVP